MELTIGNKIFGGRKSVWENSEQKMREYKFSMMTIARKMREDGAFLQKLVDYTSSLNCKEIRK